MSHWLCVDSFGCNGGHKGCIGTHESASADEMSCGSTYDGVVEDETICYVCCVMFLTSVDGRVKRAVGAISAEEASWAMCEVQWVLVGRLGYWVELGRYCGLVGGLSGAGLDLCCGVLLVCLYVTLKVTLVLDLLSVCGFLDVLLLGC